MSDKVIFTQYIEESDLCALMSGALAFTFPSLYEGFGMPPLEAMACGTPVLVSDAASLPEVTGDSAVIVKAEDTLCGKPVKVTLDLLVLMAGMVCNRDNHPLAQALGLGIDEDGYFRSKDNIASITASDRKGIFYAGAATGPKTVPETLAEARSAALDIHAYLSAQ